MISANLLAVFYLISGVLFILALRGLSSPETSRQGNLFGIIGMAIAIGVTIISAGNFSTGFLYLLAFLLVGGSIGAFRVDGAIAGFNKESQYNVFEQDGDLLFYRNVNGVIALSFRAGSNVSLETVVDGYEGMITIGEGGEIFIRITQTN